MSKVMGIFTCHNRKEKTIQCLKNLIQGNPDIAFSFIAVDDNSSDGTQEALQQYTEVHIISGDGQCYYSGGMRLGIKYAKTCCNEYDWILLLNDDVAFFPHSIEKLESYSTDKQEIVIGATCDEKGHLSYGGVLKTSGFKPSFQTVMSGKERVFCDTFNANCVLIPTAIFKTLPNIDSCYTHAMGDFDYGLEAHKRNIPIVVSDFFIGTCVANPLTGTWRDIRLPRRERLKRKESPKGLPRQEWFHFINKHYGTFSACINSITPYIKILIGKP